MTHNWNNKRDVGRMTSRPWSRLREQILRRDPLCVACSAQGRIREATEVDHIVPLAKGGTNSPDNLQALCTDCHKRKTQVDSGNSRKVAIGEDGWPVSARVAARSKPGSHWDR
jgi:5-methylcytosine-specific restriction protein A